MSGLPEGWETVKLGDAGSWSGGGTPSKSNSAFWRDGTIPWVSPKDMKTLRIADATDHITTEAVENSTTNEIASGSVLMVTRSGILAHSVPVAITDRAVTINQDLKAITPWPGVDPEYLVKCLRSMERDFLENCRKAGTTVASLDTDKLQRTPVPLPPLAEQRRIVEKLDQLSARTRAAKDHLAHVQSLATRAKQATLAAAFEQSDAVVKTIGSVASVQLGKMLDKRKNTGSEVQYLGNINVRWFVFDLSALKSLLANEADLTKFSIQDGDLMVCEGGEPGRAAIWEYGPTDVIFQKALMRVRPKSDQTLASYLLFWLYWKAQSKGLEPHFTGTTIKHLPKRALEGLELPIPSLTEQTEIVRRIEAAFARIDRMVSEATRAAELLERLEAQLLAKAFQGELVPQDPNDEPASVLLSRIREARAKAPKPKRRRKAKSA